MLFKIYNIYKRRTKIYFLLCIFSTFILSIAESVSIGIIIPILSLMISPNLLFSKFNFYNIKEYFNLIDENHIRLFILILAFIIILSTTFLKIFLFKINTKFASHIGKETATIFISKLLKSKYIFLKTINFDDYLTFSAKNIEFFTYYLVLPFINLISSFFQITFIILLLLYIDIKISITTFAFFSIIYLLFNLISKKTITSNNKIIKESTPIIISNMRNILNGFKEIHLYNKSDLYLKKLNKTFEKSFNSQSKSLYLASMPKYVIEAMAMLFLIGLLFYKISNNNNIIEILPFLTTFLLALQRLLPSFQIGYSSYTTIKTYKYINYEVYNTLQELEENRNTTLNNLNRKSNFFFNKINFSKINFSYLDNSNFIIKDFYYEITKGDKIFIQGNSGSGKSTFIDIFCGFLPIKSGVITLNNQLNFNDYINQWQSCIAYIPQKVHILNGTFYENITYSNDYNDEDLEKCIYFAKLCGIHDLIITKENQYLYNINSDFNNLSGGQLKRIAIARALYAQKSILILDEATSGLDENSELDIIQIIKSLDSETTVLYISHNIKMNIHFSKNLNF